MLISIASVLVAALLLAKLAPETPVGKALNAALIEAPTNCLSKVSLRKGVLLLASAAIVVLGAILLASWSLPPDLSLFAAIDVSAYLDLLVAVAAGAALVVGRATIAFFRAAPLHAVRFVRGAVRLPSSGRRERGARRAPVCSRSRDEAEPAGSRLFAFA
jgi:hypothetical protein